MTRRLLVIGLVALAAACSALTDPVVGSSRV